MDLHMIVAASENNVIGLDNKLPWHLPDDLKQFKTLTRGATCIMGKPTYDSIIGYLGKPLPGRQSIVMVEEPFEPGFEDVHLAYGTDEALLLAERLGREPFVTGGGFTYRAFLPHTKFLHMTRVHAVIPGDCYFPVISSNFLCVHTEHHPVDEKHALPFTFLTYRRVSRHETVENVLNRELI